MGKPLAAGHAASIGVEAADLAAAGFMANPRAIEAPQGFAAAHLGSGEKTAFLGLGAGWEMERASYKLHACCHGLHAMLEALAGLHLAPGSVDRVTVRTHPRWRAVCDIAEPRTGLEAKFSFRLTAAMALDGRDTAALETYSDAECRDPTLVALRDRVDVVSDPQLPETAAEVSLTAAGGRHHTLRHDLAEPVSSAELHSRLRRKAETLVGPEAASILAAATLEGTPDVSTLTALLRAAPA
ncbi:MAG: MmgE/PrpD family protein, partial [Pseudomonadota bacterium]